MGRLGFSSRALVGVLVVFAVEEPLQAEAAGGSAGGAESESSARARQAGR